MGTVNGSPANMKECRLHINRRNNRPWDKPNFLENSLQSKNGRWLSYMMRCRDCFTQVRVHLYTGRKSVAAGDLYGDHGKVGTRIRSLDNSWCQAKDRGPLSLCAARKRSIMKHRGRCFYYQWGDLQVQLSSHGLPQVETFL